MKAQTPRERAGVLFTLRAVLWSFFGVRRGADHDADMARLNPIAVIVTGVAAAAVLVLSLIAIVQWIVKS